MVSERGKWSNSQLVPFLGTGDGPCAPRADIVRSNIIVSPVILHPGVAEASGR